MLETLRGAVKLDEADSYTTAFYRGLMETLNEADVPFMVGGAFAFACLTGIQRDTKDLDLFIRRQDYEHAERLLREAGYQTELTYPHWLGKVRSGEAFVDLIFNSGNGVSPVDESWFRRAGHTEVLGVPVKLVPAEESVWSKAFIMERERFDGADVAHLLRCCAPHLDWQHLIDRFGVHWRVLLSHLVLFGFIYPGERSLVPSWVLDELIGRLLQEMRQPAPRTRLCGGTLLSREQYLHDIEQLGYVDIRYTASSTMEPQDVAEWTKAIPGRQEAAQPNSA